ncbi:Gfo/Idh/MocA family protein [Mobilicoccus sp.]|uniref:Gfo/Idh/MocA family protein n=1 Tax=Mobilicoccus sp. TaxID=2034349 RepID=UPI0037CB41D7
MTMTDTNLRAGLIGLGMMGRHHGRILAGLEGVDLVAVADVSGMDPHGVAKGRPLLSSIDELIAAELDYCMVAVPTAFHVDVALALADAGVHAMIEKPLAYDTPGAQKIADAFSDKGLVGAVGHIERYNPALQQARARIENGDLGDVYQIVTRRQGPFPARIADVGVVKDLATHDIDLTSWVRQQPFASVAARTAFRSGREFEDMVSVAGKLADGTITSHLVNWLSPFKERVTVITGEKGAFVADTLTADLTFHANGSVKTEWDDVANFRGVSEGDVVRYAIAKREPLLVEHENFRDAVLGKDADIVTLAQGLQVVRVAEAVLESASTGATIDL